MKKLIGIALGLLVGSPAFACGVHGTVAGNMINDWLQNNASSSWSTRDDNAETGWADGGQSRRADDGSEVAFGVDGGDDGDVEVGDDWNAAGNTNGWGNENYWVNITLPDGSVVTVNASAANWNRDGGGGALEIWLRDQGQQVIRDWFEDYEPLDEAIGDYVG